LKPFILQIMKKWIIILLGLILLVVIGCLSSQKVSNPMDDLGDAAEPGVDSIAVYEDYEHTDVDVVAVGSAGPPKSSAGPITVSPPHPVKAVRNPAAVPAPVTILETGTIAYSIPDTMTYGQVETITLRITKNETVEVITHGIAQPDRILVLENVRVSPLMTAELIDPSPDKACFVIKGINTTEQNIEEQGFTQWEWTVKPVKAGSHPLKLLIKVKTQTGTKDIPVYDQNIYVYSKPMVMVGEFWDKYWQWLFTTILIPIFIFLWKRRKKEENPE